MKLLSFDTSTERMSVAVQHGAQVFEHEGAGGAQASATLLAAIESLLGRARLDLAALDAIVFGRGPGSFTGLRTACAVAQGLGFGAGRPVLGLPTLLALAEQARQRDGATRVVATLDARMDEVYWAHYVWDGAAWAEVHAPALSPPEQVEVPAGWTVAGNAPRVYGARVPAGAACVDCLPQASALLHLAPAAMAAGLAGPAAQASPLYIRDKVAQTTEERAAARASQQGNAA